MSAPEREPAGEQARKHARIRWLCRVTGCGELSAQRYASRKGAEAAARKHLAGHVADGLAIELLEAMQ